MSQALAVNGETSTMGVARGAHNIEALSKGVCMRTGVGYIPYRLYCI